MSQLRISYHAPAQLVLLLTMILLLSHRVGVGARIHVILLLIVAVQQITI